MTWLCKIEFISVWLALMCVCLYMSQVFGFFQRERDSVWFNDMKSLVFSWFMQHTNKGYFVSFLIVINTEDLFPSLIINKYNHFWHHSCKHFCISSTDHNAVVFLWVRRKPQLCIITFSCFFISDSYEISKISDYNCDKKLLLLWNSFHFWNSTLHCAKPK